MFLSMTNESTEDACIEEKDDIGDQTELYPMMNRKTIRVPINRLKNQALVISVIGSSAASFLASKKLELGLGTFVALFAAQWLGLFVISFTFMLRNEISKRSIK